MADEPTTSGGSEIQTSDKTEIVTPGSSGEMPKTSIDDHTSKENERLKADLKRAQAESAERRKKLAVYEEKERLDAESTLSEIEKSKKVVEAEKAARAQAEAQIQQMRQQLVMAEVKLAAKSMDFINPEIVAKVIELEYDETGMPTNVQKALDDLAKSNPFLLKPKQEQLSEQQTTPAQTAGNQQPPRTPAMNPGRSTISQPNQTVPGQIVKLNDVFKRR